MRGPPRRRYVQVLLPLAIGAALIVPRLVDRGSASPADTPNDTYLVAPTTGPLPTISGTTLAGATFGPADYQGHVLVVTFWNPDCPPCRREAPALKAAQDVLRRDSGAVFVGVLYAGGNWPDDRDAARAFLDGYGLADPTVIDEGSKLAAAFAIPGIPVTVVADATGAMRYRITGGVQNGELERLVGTLGP